MPKFKTVYTCKNCGYTSYQWVGQCPNCSEWNSFVEDVVSLKEAKSGSSPQKSYSKPIYLSAVSQIPPKRISSGIGEFDRVLGGGFVPGQVILLAGEPGIGKSTILTEIAKNLKELKILYVCGEESVDQLRIRASRMDYDAKNLLVLPETNVDVILNTVENDKEIGLVIIDSIQTLFSEDLLGSPGSLVQVRGCSQILTNAAKKSNVPVVLVGHETKEGVVAGPKVLEHIVDTILYLEGDSQHLFRILRTSKNRFGAVSEETAGEMARGVAAVFGTDIGLSVSGIAGPSGGSIEKPVGLVCTAISFGKRSWSYTDHFRGDRETIQLRAAHTLFKRLWRILWKEDYTG